MPFRQRASPSEGELLRRFPARAGLVQFNSLLLCVTLSMLLLLQSTTIFMVAGRVLVCSSMTKLAIEHDNGAWFKLPISSKKRPTMQELAASAI